ncbi:MAG: hypothetical protein AB2A00_42315 [Myxococcota bacterium]
MATLPSAATGALGGVCTSLLYLVAANLVAGAGSVVLGVYAVLVGLPFLLLVYMSDPTVQRRASFSPAFLTELALISAWVLVYYGGTMALALMLVAQVGVMLLLPAAQCVGFAFGSAITAGTWRRALLAGGLTVVHAAASMVAFGMAILNACVLLFAMPLLYLFNPLLMLLPLQTQAVLFRATFVGFLVAVSLPFLVATLQFAATSAAQPAILVTTAALVGAE